MCNKDGGPAFPVLFKSLEMGDGKTEHLVEPGITIRDYFAAKAMQAIRSNMESMQTMMKYASEDSNPNEVIAKVAYEQADSMLAEREK